MIFIWFISIHEEAEIGAFWIHSKSFPHINNNFKYLPPNQPERREQALSINIGTGAVSFKGCLAEALSPIFCCVWNHQKIPVLVHFCQSKSLTYALKCIFSGITRFTQRGSKDRYRNWPALRWLTQPLGQITESNDPVTHYCNTKIFTLTS